MYKQDALVPKGIKQHDGRIMNMHRQCLKQFGIKSDTQEQVIICKIQMCGLLNYLEEIFMVGD